MELKDYLHHHLGCDMMTRDAFGRTAVRKLTAIVGSKAIYDCDDTDDVDMANSWDMDFQNDPDKPLLRLPFDMTKEENREWADLKESLWDGKVLTVTSMGTMLQWLLDRDFDVFGLIDAGLALDKTKSLTY
jgi:hypothetical protein